MSWLTYLICTKCGKPHDDGTLYLCVDCLEKSKSAPEDEQELKEPREAAGTSEFVK